MRIIKIVLIFLFLTILFVAIGFLGFRYYFPKLNSPVSILVLGKGGEGHTAPDLTDTIMFSYLNTQNNKISTVSLPRDIWIPAIRAKLNSAYYWDKQNNNSDIKLTKESILSITGYNPNYYVVVDFSLFTELIDAIGGIEIDVENAFVDRKYPIAGLENDLCNGDKTFSCRYETISFDKGLTNMNAQTALKFVRSRNAEGPEGTDLAREKRQQKVVEALKEKMLSNKVLLDPKVLKELYRVIVSNIETNIKGETLRSIVRFVYESRDNIRFLSIPEDMITVSKNNRNYDFQYVFVPKSGSWVEFQEWFNLNSK